MPICIKLNRTGQKDNLIVINCKMKSQEFQKKNKRQQQPQLYEQFYDKIIIFINDEQKQQKQIFIETINSSLTMKMKT